jgi:alpha-amylase
MCTKWFADGDVHAYFSPYESPYEAFINYMNAYKKFVGHEMQSDENLENLLSS